MAIGPTKPATPEAKGDAGDRISAFESAQTQHPDSTRSMAEPRMDAGQMIADRYRIVRVVGEGGMGVVYAAEHVLMRKEVALKVLHADMCTNPEVVARFEREAVAAAHIDHPNIAGATDFGRLADGACYLVLELLRGPSIRDEILKGPIPLARALHILRGITAGIAAAHAKGVIHRDLKPENVMLVERDGDVDFVKILDFGIAKLDPSVEAAPAGGKVLTRLGTVFGTPEYMAPEQAVGDVVDARADLYALTGKCPFEGEPMAILRARITMTEPPDLSGVEDDRARAVLARLLQKTVAARMQTANELAAALDSMLETPVSARLTAAAAVTAINAPVSSVQGFATTAPDLGEAPAASSRRRRWLLPATVLGALAIGAIGFIALMPTSTPVVASPAVSSLPTVDEPPAPPEPSASVAVEAPAIETAEPPAASSVPAPPSPPRPTRRPARGRGRHGGFR